MSDKFDFTTASNLIQAIESTVLVLETKNERMEKQFAALREGFKDSGYDDYAVDMTMTNNALKDVTSQLREIAKSISKYAEQLKGI